MPGSELLFEILKQVQDELSRLRARMDSLEDYVRDEIRSHHDASDRRTQRLLTATVGEVKERITSVRASFAEVSAITLANERELAALKRRIADPSLLLGPHPSRGGNNEPND